MKDNEWGEVIRNADILQRITMQICSKLLPIRKKKNKPQIKGEIDNGCEKAIQEMGKPNDQYNIA